MSSTQTDAAIDTSEISRPNEKWTGRVVALIVAIGCWIALYGLFPYQHGHLEHRTSLLEGLWIMVMATDDQEWIFCLFVPFISVFLVYLKRSDLRQLEISGTNWALIPLAIAGALFWLGYKADSRYFGFASAQIMAAALILWFLGPKYMRALFFPWLFFAFTWPFPPLEEMMAVPLRFFAAKSSSVVINLMGLDCFREGTALISAANPAKGLSAGDLFRLDVKDPCSGIRSLFSLIMISAFYGYIALPKPWQRLVLFAASIPLAVIGNIVRMVMLAYGCVFFGAEFAVGIGDSPSTFHMLSGVAVFIVALSGMFALAHLLELRSPIRRRRKKKSPSQTTPSKPAPIPLWRSATIVAAGTLLLVLCFATPSSPGVSPPGVVFALPETIGEYWGEEVAMSDLERRILDAEVEIVRRNYRPFQGAPITCTIVLSGAEARSIHRPEICLPGQGWSITDTDVIQIDLNTDNSINATVLSLARTETLPDGRPFFRRAYNIYFYVGSDTTTGTRHGQITRTILDGLFRNMTHRWSMVGVFAPLPPNQTNNPVAGELTVEQLKEFVREIVPSIKATDWN
ncbi:MAG: exosortase/archaeosortase family protein [Verrucomicrobiota bacterium]